MTSSSSMPADTAQPALYPAVEPYRHGMLQVHPLHTLYWEECGNPQGLPVVVLHGGPGAGCSPQHRRFFNPEAYRIVLFDQRGCGRSTPHAETRDNTTQDLVADIEQLRQHLGISQWLVFGGSWGSTLALAYGQTHPATCLGFVLRGIFLCTDEEIDWFLYGMKWIFPEAYARFEDLIPDDERHDLLRAYHARLTSANSHTRLEAAQRWRRYEDSCLQLLPQPDAVTPSDASALALACLEAHYFAHHSFLSPDQLLCQLPVITHLPACIVQGRYDVICPPSTAYRLHQAWPSAQMQMIEDAGHSAFEPGIAKALVAATDQFAQMRRFV